YTVGYDGPLRIASSHAWTLAAEPARGHQNFLAGTRATLDISRDDPPQLQLHARDQPAEVLPPAAPATSKVERFEACLLDYLEALFHDRPPRHGDLPLARQTLQIILAVYESARIGERVRLV
ncbi:MAG: hypothetical protein GTO53_09140, partial [Planctomycetales bacterium]|nr:hypothetical protein [Planctomycetales bacterium]NIM09291.1 hypothetical protein [Planctomycetales bacterium]NIN08759.1 hypothetical protein [Planctomycetales bacterium]NIN77878.1 hypothetical protein [Planctomycetales bacterium]NIO35061.1 hypothetical protein [Planctomycetales bacterium]